MNYVIISLKIINPIYSSSNENLFVFFPGTSSICDNYSELFTEVNPHINTLCINYQNADLSYLQKEHNPYSKSHSQVILVLSL